MRPLPRTRAPVQNLECVDDVGTCMSGETNVDSYDDESSVSIEETEDPADKTFTVTSGKSKQNRAGVRYSYEHDTVRHDLKKAGPYQETPHTDPFIEGFQKYLTCTLQVTNVDMNLQKVQVLFHEQDRPDQFTADPYKAGVLCTSRQMWR